MVTSSPAVPTLPTLPLTDGSSSTVNIPANQLSFSSALPHLPISGAPHQQPPRPSTPSIMPSPISVPAKSSGFSSLKVDTSSTHRPLLAYTYKPSGPIMIDSDPNHITELASGVHDATSSTEVTPIPPVRSISASNVSASHIDTVISSSTTSSSGIKVLTPPSNVTTTSLTRVNDDAKSLPPVPPGLLPSMAELWMQVPLNLFNFVLHTGASPIVHDATNDRQVAPGNIDSYKPVRPLHLLWYGMGGCCE
jgi:hypothetical protein